jgi:nicotinamide-nucleotide amidase
LSDATGLSDAALAAKADAVLAACRAGGLKVATAESCTGGMVAAALTDIAGSSDVVERGFVTYSNAAKMELLGVPAQMILAHGAVSPEVAEAMALGRTERHVFAGDRAAIRRAACRRALELLAAAAA